ncbi:MAG: ADP-heptose:LPS heptosyltransferase, partial [Cognaticolwellia sp.]
MSTLLCRLSSFGDVVLAAGVTGALGDVHFLTQKRWHSLVQTFPGVVNVLEPGDPLPKVDQVVDLQRSLRSRKLLSGTGPTRVDAQRVQRLGRVWLKAQRPVPTVLSRYAQAAGVAPMPLPWITIPRGGGRLALVPGAAHATKRWPHFAGLREALEEEVTWLGGPDDAQRIDQLANPKDLRVHEAGVAQTLLALQDCDLVIGGDTGLMHLAAACGVPTLALFGPTHPQDGFWSHLDPPLHLGLACSPCSKHGG